MARDLFVDPTITRLDLSDGHWIDVKTELNAGEHRHAFSELVKEMRAGERAVLDPERVGLTKLSEYIVAWSFTKNGKPVEVSPDALKGLYWDIFTEVTDAIDQHEAKTQAARAAEKKDPATSTASAAI